MELMKMDLRLLIICCVFIKSTISTHIDLDWDTQRPAFDPEIYENALDSEVCREQLQHIRRNAVLRLTFLDAGMRLPRGILELNNLDYGNYDQCIGINEDIGSSVVEGKYCLIQGPMDRSFTGVAKTMNWDTFDESLLSEENVKKLQQIDESRKKVETLLTGVDRSRTVIGNSSVIPTFRMALCVPKTCTTQEGIAGLLFNLTLLGFRYEEEFCRFKDDKPWVPADYVAIAIFSFIGLLTILSTSYDLFYTFYSKKDPKNKSTLYTTFSVYTNGKNLTRFTHNPNNLNCIDGIRAISTFWIVVGHTYLLMPATINSYYVFLEYLPSLKSLWITGAPYVVDTFLLLAGLLLVYTTVGKISGINLLKSLHLFYLNRILRMFPLLATLVLLQASLLFRIADGPNWNNNAVNTNTCRTYWWATLLYVQNYVNVRDQCIQHSWYLAIDIQCYILSPLVLYWLLNKKNKQAWTALTVGVMVSLTICTTYCFVRKFPGWLLAQVREGGEPEYHLYLYFNTLGRAPPFFIGMAFGYLLYTWKGRQPEIPRYINLLLWILSGGTMMTLMYITHLMKDSSWDLWIVDDLNNSFGRSIWVLCIGWIIFACQHGYGGPVNWFLCLDIWKLPSRISYAIYLFHYHMQYVIQGTARQPVFFSDALAMYHFFSQVLMAYGIAFALTLIIDSPFSLLVKLALGGGVKKSAVPAPKDNPKDTTNL